MDRMLAISSAKSQSLSDTKQLFHYHFQTSLNHADTGAVNVNLPVPFPSVRLKNVDSVVSETDVQPLRNYGEGRYNN